MSILTKTAAFTALAASLLMSTNAMARSCHAWERDFDMCIEKKCAMFTDMATNNAGSEEGTAQALVAGACLAACKAKETYCKYQAFKTKKIFPTTDR